jgi:hypothetical protein
MTGGTEEEALVAGAEVKKGESKQRAGKRQGQARA